MIKKILLAVGILLILAGLAGLVTLTGRTFPRAVLASDAEAESLAPPEESETTPAEPTVIIVTATPLPVTPTGTPVPGAETPTPTAAPPSTPSTASPPTLPSENDCESGVWIVQPGDTLSEIAKFCGVAAEDLAAVNGLGDSDRIKEGQVLLLPGPYLRETVTYTVQSGDTLYGIALRYGLTVQELVLLNGLNNPNALYPGLTLTIFAGPGVTPTPVGPPTEETGEATGEPTGTATLSTAAPPTPGTQVPPTTRPTEPYLTPATTSPSTSMPTVWPTEPFLTPATPAPQLVPVFEAEWPVKMEVGRSDTIRITLRQTEAGAYEATLEAEGSQGVVITPVDVSGTQEVPLTVAFGPDYEAAVSARLISTSVEIVAVTDERQILAGDQLIWTWNIKAEQPGIQVINGQVFIEWTPTSGEGRTIKETLWLPRFDLRVTSPLIRTGQISVLSLASAFLGSGLSIPWLIDEIKERRARKEEEGRTGEQPPSSAG